MVSKRFAARGGRRAAAHDEGTGRPADSLRAARSREEDRLAWATRGAVPLLRHPRAGRGRVSRWFASTGRAAPAPPRWCGTDEATKTACRTRSRRTSCTPSMRSRPTAPTGTCSLRLESRATSLRSTAGGSPQDPTRTLRWDLQAFPGCDSLFGGLDLTFLRLPLPASAYTDPENGGYSNLVRGLGDSFLDQYKKYGVFYDGPIEPNSGVCGVSSFGRPRRARATPSHSCRRTRRRAAAGHSAAATTWPLTAAHEMVHNLGAVSSSAPHVCASGHVCDSVADSHEARPGRPTRSSTTHSTSAATTTTAIRAPGGTCRTPRGSRT